ncbi:MAG: phosphatase PAP2 family protein, partial [Candidatus Saccharicenans sp.]|nr:phosphatase PAP2 family protein [Candidatus Saccharicenans sp.]
MRGLIYYLTSRYQRPVYCEYAVKIETAIFGQVPSVWLQSRLLPDGQTGWLEQTLTFFHGTHFIAFLIVGFLIWLKDKGHFKNYKTSFYLLLASGISLYALVPTAPPWMASNMFGLLPKLAHFNIDIY